MAYGRRVSARTLAYLSAALASGAGAGGAARWVDAPWIHLIGLAGGLGALVFGIMFFRSYQSD